jgi:hypothetical protein
MASKQQHPHGAILARRQAIDVTRGKIRRMARRWQAPGGAGTWVEVSPERLGRFVDGVESRHGPLRLTAIDPPTLTGVGISLTISSPFGPCAALPDPASPAATLLALRALAADALQPRRIGILLVRLGGFSVGIVDAGQFERTKTGSRPVHGRSAAGGWSQQRFARRREGQARVALAAAADAAARVLLPGSVDHIVTGGDRTALATVLADPRLAALHPLVVDRVLDVAEPRRATLDGAWNAARALHVLVAEGATVGHVDPDGGAR